MNIYLTKVCDVWKAPEVDSRAFSNYHKAYTFLIENGFEYSPEAELFHNGATEAFINKIKVE